jgi:hypothetical protein
MNRPYKSFDKYVDGLKRLLKYREEYLPNFFFRIFIDRTIYDDDIIMSIINSDPKVQPVLFKCQKYLDKDNYHHEGVFGTLIRFFPMFDFDNNDADYVIVTDIEPNYEDMHSLGYIYNYLISNNLKFPFIYSSNMFHTFCLHQNDPYIIANRLHSATRMPRESIIEFIFNIYKVKNLGVYPNISSNEIIQFGMDETYLNKYLIDDMLRNNVKVACYYYYNISFLFYYNEKYMLKNKLSEKYIPMIMGKYYDKNVSLRDNIRSIDRLFYKKSTVDEKMRYIANNFVKTMKYLNDNKIYDWVNKCNIENVVNYFSDAISQTGLYVLPKGRYVTESYVNNKLKIN